MSQKVFQSQKNKIIITDEFIVFDKNKSIHFDHFLVVKMNKGSKSAYAVVGQYRPGRWFTYINTKADDFIKDLISRPGVNVIEKDVVRYERYGIIELSDGMGIIWYNMNGQRYMYFKKGGDRLVYSYLPVVFFKRNFTQITAPDLAKIEWSKHDDVVLFDPWSDALAHEQSVEDYGNNRINEPDDTWNEPYGPGCWAHVKMGCLGFIIVIIILFVVGLIIA